MDCCAPTLDNIHPPKTAYKFTIEDFGTGRSLNLDMHLAATQSKSAVV